MVAAGPRGPGTGSGLQAGSSTLLRDLRSFGQGRGAISFPARRDERRRDEDADRSDEPLERETVVVRHVPDVAASADPAVGAARRRRDVALQVEAFAASEAGNEQGGAERRDENQAGERQPDAIGRRAPRRQPGSFIDGTLGRPVQGFQATAAGARLV